MEESSNSRSNIRDKIIGLGKDSIHKSYYPQLKGHIEELEVQKKAIEEKNKELVKTLVELRNTQSNLKISEGRFRTLFENANDAIFIQDDSFNVVECNQMALNLFDTDREHILDNPPLLLLPDRVTNKEEIWAISNEHMKLAHSGEPQVFELNIKGPKVKVTHILISLNRFELAGSKYLQSIIRNTSEIRKLQKELLNATIRTEEQERARFAKELHDGVGPILSTVKLYFQWLADTTDPEQREVIIEKGNKNIGEAIKALKEVSNNLSPHVLTNYGLNEGVRQFIDGVAALGKLKINNSINLKERLSYDVELTLYRVITELINNTIKHANATEINLSIDNQGDELVLRYSDNGLGMKIDNNSGKKGLGLFNIQNRIQNLDGTLKIKSKPGKGMKVKIIINLP